MISSPTDTLNKTCLVGLSYFDLNGQLLKQNLLAGRVKAQDDELGITLGLFDATGDLGADFLLPNNLACWFKAPAGDFHTSTEGVKIKNPDFLVTWDIHQTRSDKQEGEQQWWEWVPRTEAPVVNSSS